MHKECIGGASDIFMCTKDTQNKLEKFSWSWRLVCSESFFKADFEIYGEGIGVFNWLCNGTQ